MKQADFILKMDDGLSLFVRRWIPDGQVRGVLQIAHGMGEHSARYERLASLLTEAGIEVWADDHRGHGHTANLELNAPDRGGLLGHCADRDGFFRVVRDMEALSDRIREERGDLPLFLFGQSWGSFLAQTYIERSGGSLSGCILSGTRGPGGFAVRISFLLSSLIAFCTGPRRHSRLVFSLTDGSYGKAFRPNRTAFDWLSRDEAEVDRYIADPLCGFPCSIGFYRDLFSAFLSIHRPESLMTIPQKLPLFLFSGAEDPVGEMGASVALLAEAYEQQGIDDLDFVLYPQARHEPLNELNRDEVSRALLEWLLVRIPGQ